MKKPPGRAVEIFDISPVPVRPNVLPVQYVPFALLMYMARLTYYFVARHVPERSEWYMVDRTGFEPVASSLQMRRSTN